MPASPSGRGDRLLGSAFWSEVRRTFDRVTRKRRVNGENHNSGWNSFGRRLYHLIRLARRAMLVTPPMVKSRSVV
jgi:hypothetical protein